MDSGGFPFPTSHSDQVRLSVDQLQAKTRWIRDVLEPNVARFGPRYLTADIVLDLHEFIQLLLTLTRSPPATNPSITVDALYTSRVHRALLLIAGRGTRWPGKLIELCDELISVWTAKFGKLDMIRPNLYEKGGRLEKCKEEKGMKRHDLMLKWMSDPTGQVSPLRAQEFGHLDFKPGQWWIHPIFAFHSGIIDSPDPNGGITADGDGAYAILMTAADEFSSETPEEFVYRCHNNDRGRFRLLGASLPPKNSIRVLRSHTLLSVWSPTAGVRYDGLYKIMKWSLRKIDKQIVYDITFQRDLDQISMREVRLHPTAEEVDDYIEYRRLREERHVRDESARRAAMSRLELEAEDAAIAETQLEQEPSVNLMPRSRRYTPRLSEGADLSPLSKPNAQPPVPAVPHETGLMRSKSPQSYFHGSHGPPNFSLQLAGENLDGTPDQAERRPSIRFVPLSESPLAEELAHSGCNVAPVSTIALLNRVRFCEEMTDSEIREEQIAWMRRDSANFSRRSSSTGLRPKRGSDTGLVPTTSLDGSIDESSSRRYTLSQQIPDHKSLQHLANEFGALRAVTLRRDSVGPAFLEDLKGVSKVVESWELTSATSKGYVDSCLKKVERDVHHMREHGRWDWQEFTNDRNPNPITELDKLEEYQRRYEERARADEAEKQSGSGIAEEEKEGGEVPVVLGGGRIRVEPSGGGLWVMGQELLLN